MSLITKLTGLIGGGLVESIGSVADKFITTDDEKNQFMVEMEQVLQRRDSEVEQTIRAELQAKERVMVAEMAQSDNYTKRARPSVIYMGLAIISFNYCLIPLIQMVAGLTISPFALPSEFWIAWGGCVGVYSLGRSMEKRGVRNTFSSTAVGSTTIGLLD